jgi:hyperosmotically inducible protein
MHTNPFVIASRVILAGGLLAFVLAACGDDPSASKPAAKAPAPAAPAAPPAAKAPEAKPDAAKPAAEARAGSDRALAARVKEALLAEKSLNAHGIEVDAKDGAVTLFGTVENKARREQAAKIAAAIEGARSVENKLVVVAGS